MKLSVKGIEETLFNITNKIDTIAKDIVDNLSINTPKDTGAAAKEWHYEKFPSRQIVNNKPYISDLNNGSSAQAPVRFVEQTILRNRDVKPNGTIVEYKEVHP